MGLKRTWYASTIGEVWTNLRHRYDGNTLTGVRRNVVLPVTLGDDAPAKDVGRVVMVRMASIVAIDLGHRMIQEGRRARRSDIADGLASGPLCADKYSRRGMVRRFLAYYAEETGAQDDYIDAQAADLIAELLVIVDLDGIDRETVIEKAREYSDEMTERD